MTIFEGSNADLDDHVDDEIAACLDIAAPRSFFLFAGAGSGKTRSLVKALDRLRLTYGSHLQLRGQRIGVITYTNAASDEIVNRIKFDPLVEVRTIHSFAWLLIGGFNNDIRNWLRERLVKDINDLEEAERKGKTGSNASANRLAQIERKRQRLEDLGNIRKFTYSPTGDNREWDSLNHPEVIRIFAHFLSNKPVLQRILVNQYPVLLIDESQDTNHELIDALLGVQATHRTRFCLALLGDTMQRIYNDGKAQIEAALPDDWAKPEKKLNHRCPKRVVTLINKIRSAVDDHQQVARKDRTEGCLRFFIFPNDLTEKIITEKAVRAHMAYTTGDEAWRDESECKTLILEHHMAAHRMGFLEMFRPLYNVDSLQTGLLNGRLPAANFFAQQVLPLVKAEESGDKFAVARILRKASPLLSTDAIKAATDQLGQLALAKSALNTLTSLLRAGNRTFGEVLQVVADSNLLSIPESLAPFCKEQEEQTSNPFDDKLSQQQRALEEFLSTPFSQIDPYARYVMGEAAFDTHQGVKGQEFSRVMVIMDDTEARGFSFNYEELFGGKSPAGAARRASGEETRIDRTRRLFYVTCSRTKESLALVAYSANPLGVRAYLLNSDWCSEEEVVIGLIPSLT